MSGQRQSPGGRVAYLLGRGLTWLSLAGFPFSWPADRADATARRRRAFGRREIRRRWPMPVAPIAWLVMVPGWAIGAWLETRKLCRAYGEKATLWQSPRVIWWRALRHNTSPREVVEYRLGDPDTPCPDDWIFELELFRTLERLASPSIRRFAADKAAFAGFCEEQAIPHPPLLARWDQGEGRTDPTDWPEGVVLKPALSNNAQGFEAWQRQGDVYRAQDAALSPAALAARGAALSRDWGVLLAQPLLRLHPALVERELTGMPVARLITGQWPDGRIELIDAYFSAPQPGRIASNAGYGPKWPVTPATGEIEPSRSRLLPPWPGTRVEGLILPGWAHAVDAVLTGHRAFPEPVPALGWDVAFTDGGPVLLETNTGISFAMPQGTRQRPSGPGAAGALLDAWIRDA